MYWSSQVVHFLKNRLPIFLCSPHGGRGSTARERQHLRIEDDGRSKRKRKRFRLRTWGVSICCLMSLHFRIFTSLSIAIYIYICYYVYIYIILGCSPHPVTVTTRIIAFLVGDPNLNLHLHWEGSIPNDIYILVRVGGATPKRFSVPL